MKLNTLPRLAAMIVILYLCTPIAGCNRGLDDYYEQETNRVRQLLKKGGSRELFKPLDSLTNADKNNGALKLRVYQAKKEYYYYHEIKDTNNFFVDSILHAIEQYNLKDKYPADYAEVLNNIGNNAFEVNNLKKAFEYYYKARVPAALMGDTCLLGDQSYHLGMVCYRQEKYSEAIFHFQRAMEENVHCAAKNIIFYKKEELLNNIALAYTHLHQYDSALHYYSTLLTFIDTGSKRHLEQVRMKKFIAVAYAVAYGNIADIMIVQKKYDTAEALLKKSIAVNSQPEYDNRDALYTQAKLAELYYATGNDALLQQTLSDMRRPMDSINDDNINQRWARLMYQHHKKTNDLPGAIADIDAYLRLRDTVDSRSKELKQTDYVQLLQDQEKEYQLDILRKDNELSRAYLLAAASVIIIVLIIVGLILYGYRKSRHNVAALTSLNDKVNEQNKKLATAANQLTQSNNDKDRILHVVAHDLRSPVSAITMMAELIKDSDDEEEKKNLLSLIGTACQSQLTLISELLEYSGNAESKKRAVKETFDINDLALQSALLLGFKAKEKGQQIVTDAAAAPVYVNAVKEKITRVLSNLITNAIKFSPEKADIQLSVKVAGKRVIIEVKDNGIGISAGNINKIFDVFTAAKRRGTSGEQSFGLGLSICKQIIEDNGGRIWAESEEGKGSTFFVELTTV